ncbi:DDB1- and CUL4-associated factor 4-like isoform X1 [Biomphalaria pfeifferi]|uniref:DDB1- and CUL4-associated factor 4-like isoform X1 n=1 Tax=Biomphalaria pfeifferi TaxID=112525 RepID=A0AAD8BMT3_BIOPF|nr:DDB1- and CUL4-associated factor 4-like isoform X1 [Biomphalaria pfeifferi]
MNRQYQSRRSQQSSSRCGQQGTSRDSSCLMKRTIKKRNNNKYTSNNGNRADHQNHIEGNHFDTSSLDETGQVESDIPGYYYDKEKKTYFKILPNTMSCVSSFVTKETIRKQEAEKQRLLDLKKVEAGSLPKTQQQKKNEALNLLSVLKSVQCGLFTCENLMTYTARQMCCVLKQDEEWPISSPTQLHLTLDEIQKMEVTTSRDKLICVSSVKSCLGQCIQLLAVGEGRSLTRKEKKLTYITIKPLDIVLGPVYKKISSLCLAPTQSLSGMTTVMYTTVCPIGYMPSMVYMCNLDAPTTDTMTIFELNLGFKTVWSAAWDSQRSRFSVGSEQKCHLIDAATRRRWTYNTCNSDPLSQTFSPNSCNILYNGTRSGLILVHDARCQGQIKAQMKQHHGVGCLKLLQNDNHILASDFSGTICLWDLRKQKVLMKYKGLVNSHYQLPFHVDETETLLCSSGSDSYTKLWDIKSGELLRSFPPPYPASFDSFPVSIYSQHWGKVPGNAGLIVALKNKFVTYT